MGDQETRKSVVMAEIHDMGHQDEATAQGKVVPSPLKKVVRGRSPKRVISPTKGEFSALATGEDGTLKEEWDPFLPRPPSMRKLVPEVDPDAEQVAVFNANTQEGSTMVRVLSEKGLKVVAAVRVFTSKNAKALINLKGVTVKVADWSDEKSLLKVAEGCTKAFLVTKYWEKFDSRLEEQMATTILKACASVKPPIQNLVLATFEDTADLRRRGRKSQLIPTIDGRIFPSFKGMEAIDKVAKEWKVQITHMMTSYLDEDDQKKSIILIRGENGRIIVQPYFKESNKNKVMM